MSNLTMTNYNERLDEIIQALAMGEQGVADDFAVGAIDDGTYQVRDDVARGQAKQDILDWHNKQVEEVLDRLEAQWGESIDQTMGEPIRFRFVHLSVIEAERNKLKEINK